MNVTCDKCNKRYSIADDKVRGKSVKIRCKQCQNLISVQGPAAIPSGIELGGGAAVSGGWEEERTRAMPAMDVSAQWFAMVKGKQLGPFDLKDLEGRVKLGELTLRTYLWKQGMGDWKRASDVPEVSPVFAGVSVGASATGPVSAVSLERPTSKRVPAVRQDVAVALETPSPEITGRNTNGNGHRPTVDKAPEPAAVAPVTRTKVPSQARTPARPASAPLSDLFSPESNTQSVDEATAAPQNVASGNIAAVNDPFAALGPSDPAQVPAVGEATKFFIAQAGVNKRNPPWKIALFALGVPGAIIGTLFLLSTLKIVPLEVTRTNDKGEEVKESFFSSGGVSGIKDLFSGEAAKKKAVAEQARLAAAEKRRRDAAVAAADRVAKPDRVETPERPQKPSEPKLVDPALALIYGKPSESGSKGPRVRAEDRLEQKSLDSTGLTQEASQKVMADKLKAFEGCIEQAMRRNPNLSVGPIDVVLNVGASGAVTSASINPAKHNNADWGQCMREVARRIVFPKSDGDSEVNLPLKVGVAVSP